MRSEVTRSFRGKVGDAMAVQETSVGKPEEIVSSERFAVGVSSR